MTTWTVQPSGGNYTTLASALSNGSTVASDTIEISGDWTSTTDTTAASVADDNITIQTKIGDQARHAGFDNAGSNYELRVGAAHALTINNTGCVVDGLLIQQDGTGNSDECVRFLIDGGTFTIKNCVLWCSTENINQDCMHIAGTIDGTIIMENSIFMGAARGGFFGQNQSGVSDFTLTANSCGFWNNGRLAPNADSLNNHAGGFAITTLGTGGGTKTMDLHNCWSIGNEDIDSRHADYNESSDTGTNTWGISYCIDGDNSIASRDSGGAGTLASRAINESTGGGAEIIVVDITSSPFNLKLVDDDTNNDAQQAHTVDTAEGITIPSTDIAGTTRPQDTSHDIGPFELEGAAGIEVTPSRYAVERFYVNA